MCWGDRQGKVGIFRMMEISKAEGKEWRGRKEAARETVGPWLGHGQGESGSG